MASNGDRRGRPRRCDYCGLPLGGELRTVVRDGDEYAGEGDEYVVCSRACEDAIRDADHPSTERHAGRRFDPGVAALRDAIPEGMPRDAFVLLADEVGTRTDALQAEFAWRALRRGEHVVFVSFLEPPISVVQTFADADWNPIPALESGRLHLVDCFTRRLGDAEQWRSHLTGWNRHLHRVASERTTVVADPTELGQVHTLVDDRIESVGMRESGLVVVDSLTELGAMVQPVKAYNFVRDVRADVCKAQTVPIVAGATVGGDEPSFPHDLQYMFDGVIDLSLFGDRIEDALVKELRVRKLDGVRSEAHWTPYEVTPDGVVPIDAPPADRSRRGESGSEQGLRERVGDGERSDSGARPGDSRANPGGGTDPDTGR